MLKYDEKLKEKQDRLDSKQNELLEVYEAKRRLEM